MDRAIELFFCSCCFSLTIRHKLSCGNGLGFFTLIVWLFVYKWLFLQQREAPSFLMSPLQGSDHNHRTYPWRDFYTNIPRNMISSSFEAHRETVKSFRQQRAVVTKKKNNHHQKTKQHFWTHLQKMLVIIFYFLSGIQFMVWYHLRNKPYSGWVFNVTFIWYSFSPVRKDLCLGSRC